MGNKIINAAFIGGGVSAAVGLGIYSERCKEIKYNSFSGSSIGAIIAVCLAAGKEAFEIKEFFQEYVEEFCQPIIGTKCMEKRVNEFLGVSPLTFDKFCTISVSPIFSRKTKIIDNRCHVDFDCGEVVAGSSAYPGLFMPKRITIGEKSYRVFDGGLTSNPPLPVKYDGDDEIITDVFGFYRTVHKPINRYVPVECRNEFFAPTKTAIRGTASNVRTAFYEGVEYYRALKKRGDV